MPKLGDYKFILDTVAFLYISRAEAADGLPSGATGFFVTVPFKSLPDRFHHVYLVTNRHVARHQPLTVRVNTRDGGIELIEISKWFFRTPGPDVAIAPIRLDPRRHMVEAFRADSWLLSEEEARRLEIDAGDDVFMVGRFVDHDGGRTNRPALRFGHISMKEARVEQPETGHDGPSFIIDLHSRSGFSGSPVFVYRTGGSIFAPENTIMGGGHMLKLLGIHWGQFPELWELSLPAGSPREDNAMEASLVTDGQYVKGLSGMTCVAPAWGIASLLGSPELEHLRIKEEQAYKT